LLNSENEESKNPIQQFSVIRLNANSAFFALIKSQLVFQRRCWFTSRHLPQSCHHCLQPKPGHNSSFFCTSQWTNQAMLFSFTLVLNFLQLFQQVMVAQWLAGGLGDQEFLSSSLLLLKFLSGIFLLNNFGKANFKILNYFKLNFVSYFCLNIFNFKLSLPHLGDVGSLCIKLLSHSTYYSQRKITLIFNHINLTFYKNLVYLVLISRLLLLLNGVEPNPGPFNLGKNSTSLSIISQNCRGLTDNKKAIRSIDAINKIIDLVKPSARVVLLQECHEINTPLLEKITKMQIIASNGTRNQAGVAICLDENINIIKDSVIRDPNGRFAICAITSMDDQNTAIIITNVYAPNNHNASIDFFHDVVDKVNHLNFELQVAGMYSNYEMIIGGDFNCAVQDSDRSGIRNNSEKVLGEYIRNTFGELGCIDSCLKSKNNANRTWKRQHSWSRIDYIFLSKNLWDSVNLYEPKWSVVDSDHATVMCNVGIKSAINPGRSFPKLYMGDIENHETRNLIRNYLQEEITNMPNEWNPHQRLEFVKLLLRSKVLELRGANRTTDSLKNMKDELDRIINNSDISINGEKIAELQFNIQTMQKIEDEKARIKAGIKWIEDGEKSSKYFLNMCKARQQAKLITRIESESGEVFSTQPSICETIKKFYQDLYARKNTDTATEQFFEHCPTLDPIEAMEISKPITIEELTTTLKTCGESAPGLDGIPYSYYKVFGDLILPLVLNSWNYGIETGSLAPSHRRSCISLLPKKDKDLSKIGNWRPISLSSCDLKIVTKCLANRIKPVLNSILAPTQAAYVPGRDINFNNRLLQIAKNYSVANNKNYCMVSLDAKKAFDSVDHSYLSKVLEIYGFDHRFIGIFNTLYNDCEAVVQVNGHLSSPFGISRGVKQGDALSCALFVLAIDPLIRNIENNERIRPLELEVNNNESVRIKSIAYADDITIVCKNSNGIQFIFDEYEKLSRYSGLILNADKTEIFNFKQNSNTVNNIRYLNEIHKIGRKERIKVCGMIMSLDPEIEYKANITDRIDKLRANLKMWSRRNLSMNGRMIIAKTFGLSQLTFAFQYYQIEVKDLKRIEKIIYSYVNTNKSDIAPERIARKYLKNRKENGGINGVDLEAYHYSITFRQYSKSIKQSHAIRNMLPILHKYDFVTKICHYRSNILWRKHSRIPDNIDEVRLISGLHPSHIMKQESRALKLANSLGLNTAKDIQDAIVNEQIGRRSKNIILKGLPAVIRIMITTGQLLDGYLGVCLPLSEFLDEPDKIKSMALQDHLKKILKKCEPISLATIHKKPEWTNKNDAWISEIWKIKHPTLRHYRYKLLMKDIFCQERMKRFGMVESEQCKICGQRETVQHQLFDCINAQKLRQFAYMINNSFSINEFYSLIEVTENKNIELIKCIIIKFLIQVDRSKDLTYETFNQYFQWNQLLLK
jgi:exonuclease III